MTRTSVFLTICLVLISWALPTQAQEAATQCAYNFTSGSGNTFQSYCVTVNGNVPQIYTLEQLERAVAGFLPQIYWTPSDQ
jgi:hypothetical protein